MLKFTISRPRRPLGRFARDQRGGVAVMFGIAFVPMAFLSLVMIDYARASNARQHLQEDLDAATLIAARSTAIAADDIDAIGDRAFAAQLDGQIDGVSPNAQGRVGNATFGLEGNVVVGTVTATSTPIVANLFIGGPIQIGARSEVVRSLNKMEIALVLDTTGSMENYDRIEKLKVAATNFVTTMQAAAARSTDPNAVKISVVPFSTTVKVSSSVSMSSYNTSTHSGGVPSWMDGRARAWTNEDLFNTVNTDRFTLLKQMSKSWAGCVEARKAPYDIRDDAPVSTNTATLFPPFFWPDEPDGEDDYKNDYLNDGGSGSLTWKQKQGREQKYNTSSFKVSGTWSQGSGYGAALEYGPNAGCAMQKVQRLTNDYAAIKDTIDDLVASGETNIPLGLMWGWHTISPHAPFADGASYTATPSVTKIIVLMTDGDNTMNDVGSDNANNSWYHGYGYIWQNKLGVDNANASTRTQKMNDKMVASGGQEALCSNIKAKGIIVYAVGVGVSSNAKDMLKACATTTGHYYDVTTSASNLDAAFSAIAGSIDNLRIRR